MLKVTFDYSEESHHDKLVRNTPLQMCLSVINHLGFRGQHRPRTFGSKFAALALNARNIVVLVTIASNTPANIREKISPLDEPGTFSHLLLHGPAQIGYPDLLVTLVGHIY
jgi:mediator of RNA polymerase II transcription subunit 16